MSPARSCASASFPASTAKSRQVAMRSDGQAHERGQPLTGKVEHQGPLRGIGREAQRVVRAHNVVEEAAHRVVVGEHGQVARHFPAVGRYRQPAQRMLVAQRRDHVVAAVGHVDTKTEGRPRDIIAGHLVQPGHSGLNPPGVFEAGINGRGVLVDNAGSGRCRFEAVAALLRVRGVRRDRSKACGDSRTSRTKIETM